MWGPSSLLLACYTFDRQSGFYDTVSESTKRGAVWRVVGCVINYFYVVVHSYSQADCSSQQIVFTQLNESGVCTSSPQLFIVWESSHHPILVDLVIYLI